MLTVLVAGTAAAAAIFGQFFSTLQSKSENASLLNTESIYEQTLPQILPEADKQVDAFFVSHGMAQQQPVNEPVQLVEPVIEIPKDKPIHEISKISEIGNGENWLILSYVPWCPLSQTMMEHFKSHYAQVVNEALQLAIVDVEAHPEMIYHLQSRQYPSLTLVTEDSRIRPWPFPGRRMNPEILAFLEHSQWRYLPVFQRLNTNEAHPLYLKQLRLYNHFAKQLTALQPQIISFIQANRQLTGTSLAVLSTAALALKKFLIK